ncbi:MAG: DUF3301 domain-containing protein [Psychromonas sp.]|nr:DUF3301 domain-containing protein [Psychromonas sp.]
MTNLLFILFSIIAGALFWKLRQQSEYAKELISRRCCELDLQLLSVARSQFNFSLGKDCLQASFVFEFSSDNDNCYQGRLLLNGLHNPKFELPVYRSFEDGNSLN